MFVDVAKIFIKAGRGGDGAVAFHREKYVASGGPDGGDGGRGGNIVFAVDDHMSTLLDFRYKRKYAASAGQNGAGKRCYGRDGEDLVIKVPRGTLIKDAKSGAILHDMSDSRPFIAARGGRGGWGNCHFATPTRQTPRFAKPGTDGEEREIQLELKLLADVGLLGFPNVGKSTLLSTVSAARPKIANYHFTTLTPNLGVVSVDDTSFVMADIPGIIEGASEGAGLGHDFLRHIDRCRLLVHIVDISGIEGRDPVEDFNIINEELRRYNADLASRPQIVAGNKADIVQDEAAAEKFKEYIEGLGLAYFTISAATRSGVDDLMREVAARLASLPPIAVYEDQIMESPEEESADELAVYKEDGAFYVEAKWIPKLIESINFGDRESLQYFQRVLRKKGVVDRLSELGADEGDTVVMCGVEFDFVP